MADGGERPAGPERGDAGAGESVSGFLARLWIDAGGDGAVQAGCVQREASGAGVWVVHGAGAAGGAAGDCVWDAPGVRSPLGYAAVLFPGLSVELLGEPAGVPVLDRAGDAGVPEGMAAGRAAAAGRGGA